MFQREHSSQPFLQRFKQVSYLQLRALLLLALARPPVVFSAFWLAFFAFLAVFFAAFLLVVWLAFWFAFLVLLRVAFFALRVSIQVFSL